jgi:hypothetical protein
LFGVCGFFRALARGLLEFDTMRTIIFFLCLSPAVANAYEVRAIFGLGRGSAGMFPSPDDAIFRVGPLGGPAILEWTIPGITPADSGRVWTIDETSAPFDWTLLEAAVDDPGGLRFSSEFTSRVDPVWPSNIVMRRV